jgi:hypothetical protein
MAPGSWRGAWGFPFRSGGGSFCGSKLPDAQAAYETANTLNAPCWAGVNFHAACLRLAGRRAGGVVREIRDGCRSAGHLHKLAAGVAVDENAQAMDAIREVGPGGHYLGCAHTQAHFKDAFWRTDLFDYKPFETWYEEGARVAGNMLYSYCQPLTEMTASDGDLPSWLPDPARRYLDHVGRGLSLREVARAEGVHPSTVMRQVRRYENRRDDPLIDEALTQLCDALAAPNPDKSETDPMSLTAQAPRMPDETVIEREARRILRRLSESGAFLAVAPGMDKAAVFREQPGARPTRTAVVDRAVAHAFALKEWIACFRNGKLTAYEITSVGRAALKRLLAKDKASGRPRQGGFAEAPAPFADQHRSWETREVASDTGRPRERVRYNVNESPLTALARRREKDGRPFLSAEQVEAGERLREDFELAQMGPRVAQNWERFLVPGASSIRPSSGPADGSQAARDRLAEALGELGPGLGDIVMRVCCFLEGLEAAEKRMGWSARSGKIVLRIALERLRQHYERKHGRFGPLIG